MDRNTYQSVSGYIDQSEAETLQTLCNNKVVLEIGTHCGRSTIAIAAVASHVVTIDHYLGDSMIGPIPNTAAEDNMALHNITNVEIIKGDWLVWLLAYWDKLKLFNVIFYDAGHTPPLYEENFLAVMKEFPGMLILHDYAPHSPNFAATVAAIDKFERITGRKRHGTGRVVWFEPLEAQ